MTYAYIRVSTKQQNIDRQYEEIKISKEKGVKFSRPKVVLPPNTNDILDKYISKN